MADSFRSRLDGLSRSIGCLWGGNGDTLALEQSRAEMTSRVVPLQRRRGACLTDKSQAEGAGHSKTSDNRIPSRDKRERVGRSRFLRFVRPVHLSANAELSIHL